MYVYKQVIHLAAETDYTVKQLCSKKKKKWSRKTSYEAVTTG